MHDKIIINTNKIQLPKRGGLAMKKAFSILIIILASLIVLAGCYGISSEAGNDMSKKTTEEMIQGYVDRLLSGEMTQEELERLNPDIQEIVARRSLELLFPPTEEQLEQQRLRAIERRRTNLSYIVRGDYEPAPEDFDLNTMERLVFFDNINDGGYTLILDLKYGKVYFDAHSALIYHVLDSQWNISVEFEQEHLDRTIAAIEQSGMRNWPRSYLGANNDDLMSSRTWIIGILFADGTMFRRSGSSSYFDDVVPPQYMDDFNTFTDFILEIGSDIIKRHEVENVYN
jgi:hypothetical protein